MTLSFRFPGIALVIACSGLSLLTTADVAKAQLLPTQTYSSTLRPQTQTGSINLSTNTGIGDTGTLSQFNPSLGTLERIDLGGALNLQGTYSVLGITAAAPGISGDIVGFAQGFISAPGISNSATSPATFNAFYTAPAVGQTVTGTFVNTSIFVGGTSLFKGDSRMAAFIGSGTVNVNMSAAVGIGYTRPTVGTYQRSYTLSTQGGIVYVLYSYTPAPIPTPSLLPGLVGLGLGLWQKRKLAACS